MLSQFVASYVFDKYEYDYWHCAHPKSTRISQGDYFIDFSAKTDYSGPFDTRGIPLLDLTSQHWSSNRAVVYSPIVIAEFGLGWYSRYLCDRTSVARERFLNVADWLLGAAVRGKPGGPIVSLLFTDYGDGNVISGMAQGLSISVWCRAFRETGRVEYLERAMEAFRAFTLQVDEGGVVDSSLGYAVLEEWLNERIHIFNGHLFAFAGIVDLLAAGSGDNKREIRDRYELYLASSVRMAKEVDLGFWTRYSLRPSLVPNIASHFYQRLHVDLLLGLYETTGSSEFLHFAERFERQRRRMWNRVLALVMKLADRLSTDLQSRLGRRDTHHKKDSARAAHVNHGD